MPAAPDPESSSARPHDPATPPVVEEQVARGIVAAYRARLHWLLRVPEWTDLYARGAEALGLPGQRQGIRWEAALQALALEHKHQLVRWVAQHFNHHLSRAVAQRLWRVVGLERIAETELDSTLTLRQWGRVRESMLFRLAREHARYKHAQQWLFVSFHHLVEPVVSRVVFAERHRADCAQEGRVALLQAIDRVDTSGDFAAYASAWIRRAVRNFLVRERLPVHAPVNLIVSATSAGSVDTAAAPATDAGAERLQAILLEMLRTPSVSLDRDPADGAESLADTLADPAVTSPALAAARADLCGCVARELNALTDKQRDVIERRYGLGGAKPATLAEIARTAGISHQQVSMRERRALQRLETSLRPVVAENHAAF